MSVIFGRLPPFFIKFIQGCIAFLKQGFFGSKLYSLVYGFKQPLRMFVYQLWLRFVALVLKGTK